MLGQTRRLGNAISPVVVARPATRAAARRTPLAAGARRAVAEIVVTFDRRRSAARIAAIAIPVAVARCATRPATTRPTGRIPARPRRPIAEVVVALRRAVRTRSARRTRRPIAGFANRLSTRPPRIATALTLAIARALAFTRPLALTLTLPLALAAFLSFGLPGLPGRPRRTFGRLATAFRPRRTRRPRGPWSPRRRGPIPGVVGIDRRNRTVGSDDIAARFGAIPTRPAAAEAAPTRPAFAFATITLAAFGRGGIALWIFVL
ncbi:MAG TPA: hypothetical protein VFH22_03605 [Rhodocyclaceae bacterium]|nr:hypothetical protein [Rhodocyclaceae bacterium]